MIAKIDVSQIVKSHLGTLRDADTGRLSFGDWLLFYLIPIFISIGLCWSQRVLDKDEANMLIQAYAILVGLLFNLLVLVLTEISKEQESSPDVQKKIKNSLKLELLRETFSNISYCVLAGIANSLFIVLSLVDCKWLHLACSFAAYAGSANFILTLLMILKRVHRLFEVQFESGNKV